MLRAAFIGIDKHANKGVRDLTGAQRDALALWSLFCDTIPDIEAELLENEQATTEKIRTILDATLGAASSEDTVVLTFAGHGTQDHRLVTHDTNPDDLANTTIPMAELADRFKRSRAKAILFVLDCCFSGAAPARVLDGSPVSRDPGIPLRELVGEGRFLIAASNINELAYEHPVTRHGLLTQALMDVFREAEDMIDVPASMNEVMQRVRAEATRLGFVQTPVSYGHVVGGLILPALRPGERFYAAFPEVRGIRISTDIASLAGFGIPNDVLDAWTHLFSGGLNNLQLQAVNDCRILDGESLLVIAPTSSGKTFIGELAAVRAITEGRKAVFLLPYRALVNEKYDHFSVLYGEHLDMRIVRCTGDYADQTELVIKGKYDLAILTFEMFLNIAVSNSAVLNHIGLVVVDEAQFITDPRRGIAVELLLTYLLTSRARGVAPQVIALSAVIGDVNDFDVWLGCKKLVTEKRPVPLVEGVLDRTGMFQYLDTSGNTQTSQLLPPVYQRKEKPSRQDMIVPLVQKLLAENAQEKIIIFRNQRGSAEGTALYLANELGLTAATEAIDTLPQHDLSSTSERLRTCLLGGTAFHNTNLTREEKAVVERVFRSPDSPVRVLGATTTLAAGINTPASTVILAEQEFIGEDGRPFTVAEYKNMAGRAGRLGFNEKGKAIILADNVHERQVLFQRYVMGTLEGLHSSFDPQHLETWVLRLLTHIDRIPRSDIVRLLAHTYGGFVANKRNPKWRVDMEAQLETFVEKMLKLGIVELEGEDVQLTLLGHACGRSALSFASALRLVEILKGLSPDSLTALRLMALIQGLAELDDSYTPVMKKGSRETVRQREARERYGEDAIRSLQRFVRGDQFIYYARCKRAAILWDWTQGVSTETLEQRYSTTPYQGRIGYGDIRRFADATRFHLRSAYQIADIMLFGEGPNEVEIEALLKQLETGIPRDGLALLDIPLPLERGEYLALYRADIRSEEDLWTLDEGSIKRILGPARATEVERFRPILQSIS